MRLSLTTGRWLILISLIFAGVHGPYLAKRYEPNSWLFADGSFYFTTLRAIVEHGRLEQKDLQPRSWYLDDLGWNRSLTDDWSNVALGREGRWYPKHNILMPLLGLPLYLVFGVVGTLMTNVLVHLVFILLIFLLARRFIRDELAAIITCAIMVLPFIEDVSYGFSNDLFGGLLLLGALECTFAGRFGWAGVLSGFAIWSRVTNAAFLPALVIVGVDQGDWRRVGRAAAFALIPLGLYAAVNTWMFGAPWIMSYERVLVRENGAATIASHARLFFVPWKEGLHRIVFDDDGVFKSFPPLAPALVGLLVLGIKRPRLAVGLLLFFVLPALSLVKYSWYRPHFLYADFGASGIGLAALLGWVPFLAPRPAPIAKHRRWLWPAVAVLALIAISVSIVWRLKHLPPRNLLSSYVKSMEVHVGRVPCDYWNPQPDRWECSHVDQGGGDMTGAMHQPENVGGVPRLGIWMPPNRDTRRIAFRSLPARHVELSFALTDDSPTAPVDIEAWPSPAGPPTKLMLSRPGQEGHLSLDLGPKSVLEIRAHSTVPTQLIVEGKLE